MIDFYMYPRLTSHSGDYPRVRGRSKLANDLLVPSQSHLSLFVGSVQPVSVCYSSALNLSKALACEAMGSEMLPAGG